MDAAAAMSRIAAFCPPNEQPVLTVPQVEEMLRAAAAPDEDGYAPADDEWTPTYSAIGVWRAVTRGWEMKAAALIGDYDFTTDGQTFRRSQMRDHCEEQARIYRRKTIANAKT